VITRPPDACASHRHRLADVAAGVVPAAGAGDALRHLDRCRACEEEVTAIALALFGLRRIAAEVATVEPPGDAWTRLLGRLSRRSRAPWRWRLTLHGMVASTMLVAVLVGSFGLQRVRDHQHTVPALTSSEIGPVEQAYINAVRVARPSSTITFGSVPRLYPDGIRPVQKEVDLQSSTGRPTVAI
jgi:hypothetical protein